MATPYATVTLEEVASTQDEARRRATPRAGPVLVVAGRQTEGRGRLRRGWRQAPRALASSLAFRPGWPSEAWPRLTLVAGLAVRESLAIHTGSATGLKWPNDLVTDKGKVGGVLTEAGDGLVVIGCGVNLWWPDGDDRPEGAAAVADDDPGVELAPRLAAHWATRTLEVAAGAPGSWGRDDYRAVCVTLGERIVWEPSGSGRAVDVDAAGGLVVETAAGTETLVAGEVRSVRHRGGDGAI